MRPWACSVATSLLVVACGEADPPAGATGSTTADAETSTSSSSTTETGSTGTSTSADSSSEASTAAESSSDTGVVLECPTYASGQALAEVGDAEIVEASGLVASRTHAGVLWVHNDSGDDPRAFAIDRQGQRLAEITIGGAFALDWEDMAIGPGPEDGVDYLYFGDIGDNGEIRANVTVYRVREPDPAAGDATVDDVTAIALDYPDGSHDAETLLVDPLTGDLLIVTKARSGMSGVFLATAPLQGGTPIELAQIATLAFGSSMLPGGTTATAGDISADGTLVAVRTYDSAYAWLRAPGATLAEAFAGAPCSLPLVAEPQGETLAITDDGFITLGEGDAQPLWFFARES